MKTTSTPSASFLSIYFKLVQAFPNRRFVTRKPVSMPGMFSSTDYVIFYVSKVWSIRLCRNTGEMFIFKRGKGCMPYTKLYVGDTTVEEVIYHADFSAFFDK